MATVSIVDYIHELKQAGFTDQQSEEYNYLVKFIFPGFMKLINSNLDSMIWSKEGELIIATNRFAKSLGFNDWHEMQGISFTNPKPDIFPILRQASTDKVSYALEVLKDLSEIRKRVVQVGLPISVLMIHPFNCIFKTSFLLEYIPLFNSAGEIIAVQSFKKYFDLFGIQDYLLCYEQKELNVATVIKDAAELPIKLTPRQHEILFLILTGMSQRNTANILNISRSTVAILLREAICPKFDIYDSDTSRLKKKAKELNFHKYLPVTLCKPWIIELNNSEDDS